MTGAEVIAVVMAVLVAVLAGVLVAALSSLTRALRDLRDAVEELRAETLPLVDELHEAVDATVSQVERVDRLITAAEGLEDRVDSATRLAYKAFQSPVVKAMAIGAGVSEAGKRIRGKAAEPAPIPPIGERREPREQREQRGRRARRRAKH